MPNSRKVYRFGKQARSWFLESTNFYRDNGKIAAPFREFSINPKNPDYRMMEIAKESNVPSKKVDSSGARRTRQSWGAHGVDAVVLTPKEVMHQILIAAHQLPIAVEHWKFAIAHSAKHIFVRSFKDNMFHTKGSKKWKPLSSWTIKKRIHKGTWHGSMEASLLKETHKLSDENSFKIFSSGLSVFVQNSVRYAGIHNCPEPGMTYGNGFGGKYSPAKPVTQRQFMGHSTYIDEFINMAEPKYLFDTVFRRPR